MVLNFLHTTKVIFQVIILANDAKLLLVILPDLKLVAIRHWVVDLLKPHLNFLLEVGA